MDILGTFLALESIHLHVIRAADICARAKEFTPLKGCYIWCLQVYETLVRAVCLLKYKDLWVPDASHRAHARICWGADALNVVEAVLKTLCGWPVNPRRFWRQAVGVPSLMCHLYPNHLRMEVMCFQSRVFLFSLQSGLLYEPSDLLWLYQHVHKLDYWSMPSPLLQGF